MAEIVQISEAPKADGLFRPVFIADREAWICQRLTVDHAQGVKPQLKRETYGARATLPGGEVRFSPFYVFKEADAQAQCDMLNGGR